MTLEQWLACDGNSLSKLADLTKINISTLSRIASGRQKLTLDRALDFQSATETCDTGTIWVSDQFPKVAEGVYDKLAQSVEHAAQRKP